MKIELGRCRCCRIRGIDALTRFGMGCLLVFGMLGLAWPSIAQEVRVQVERGPYYVGEAFEVQVIASDFDAEPTPEISAGHHSGGQLRFNGISPSTSTSISFVNGKLSRVHEVKFVYRYAYTGTAEGKTRIPEFEVRQAGTSRSTRGFDVEIVGVPRTNSVSIELELPEGPIFVGQKIPIAVEFRIERATQQDLISYQAHVPLFDVPTLRFLDEPPPRTDTNLEISTQAGILRLPAVSSERVIGGRASLVVRAERTMIALSTDEIRADAPKVFISRGSGFRRDVFNQRRATSTEKLMSVGKPTHIEVADVPREGRPASFAGAVGSGFSLEVDADRSVVQLGEPIMLSFHLRGDGDLSSASLPALDAEGLFDSQRFRLPKDSPAGIVDENGKHFDVTLRVLDAGVREIPALAYSWFDAQTRRFETTYSRPIALSVGAAEIIGADAVTRSEKARTLAKGETPAEPAAGAQAGDGTARSTRLSLTGANLAVDRDLDRLMRDQRARGQNLAITLTIYAVGLGLLVLAIVLTRIGRADPRLVARTRAFRHAMRSMQEVFSESKDDGAAALGRILRELVASLPDETGPEFDALIAECDTLRFAPTEGRESQQPGASPPVPIALQERARLLLEARMNLDSGSQEDR